MLAGKYSVERVLASGGMGVVVCARHLQLGERVALKLLRPEVLTSADAVARFDREARAAVKIKSEHVARIIDVGRLENGAPYMVMEYLEGRDLAQWLEQRGPLPVEQAVELVLQACEAIAEAHVLGIIHRDLKPANLFCIERSGLPSIKVLDFGISKLTGTSAPVGDMSMTRTQSLMGSPFYMSPEQMQSIRTIDVRSDIWALGVILFELVSQRLPFNGDGIPELAVNIMSAPTPALRAFCPDAPPLLEQVIQKCLEKERANRYANVAELAQALVGLAPKRGAHSVDSIVRIIGSAGLSTSSPPPPAAPSSEALPPPRLTAPTMPSWGHKTAPRSPRRTVALMTIAAVTALAGVLAVVGVTKEFGRGSAATANTMPSSTPTLATSVGSSPSVRPPGSSSEGAPFETLSTPEAPKARAAPSSMTSAAARSGVSKVGSSAKPACSSVPDFDNEGNIVYQQVCQ